MKLIAYAAASLVALVINLVKLAPQIQLRRRGTRTVATLTDIQLKPYKKTTRYYATAQWKDEEGRERSGKIEARGTDFFKRAEDAPREREEIIYNERHAALADRNGEFINMAVSALLMLALFLFCVWALLRTYSFAHIFGVIRQTFAHIIYPN